MRQASVVGRHVALALQDVNVDVRLVVDGRSENLGTPNRDGGVARDERRKHAASRLDAQRKRSHVEQKNIVLFARQNSGLQRRTDSDDLVWIDLARGRATEKLRDL